MMRDRIVRSRARASVLLFGAAFAFAPLVARAAELDGAAIDRVLKDAHAKFAGVTEGANADYIPALAKVPAQLFGIALVTPDGVYTVGPRAVLDPVDLEGVHDGPRDAGLRRGRGTKDAQKWSKVIGTRTTTHFLAKESE